MRAAQKPKTKSWSKLSYLGLCIVGLAFVFSTSLAFSQSTMTNQSIQLKPGPLDSATCSDGATSCSCGRRTSGRECAWKHVSGGCDANSQCSSSETIIEHYHYVSEQKMKIFIRDAYNDWRQWITEDFLPGYFVDALAEQTEQIVTIGQAQALSYGMFMDAKHQLESQRLFQELEFEANQDYAVTDEYCTIGTNTRGLAASDSHALYTAAAFNALSHKRHMGNDNLNASGTRDQDKAGRWRKFLDLFCDVDDNADEDGNPGLQLVCGSTKDLPNADVNYTDTIDKRRTINADFTLENPGEWGEAVIALGQNLFGHDSLSTEAKYLDSAEGQSKYMLLRSVQAKRSVAEASFAHIVGLRTAGSEGNTGNFIKPILTGMGYTSEQADKMVGDKPSYYVQLETLARFMFQNPDFFVELYNREADIQRKSTALSAIEVLLDRAIAESEMRQEMLMSVYLTAELDGYKGEVERNIK